jgi:hypothetical protein
MIRETMRQAVPCGSNNFHRPKPEVKVEDE